MQNETIDKLKNAGYITVTDDSQGIADKVGISGGDNFPYEYVCPDDFSVSIQPDDWNIDEYESRARVEVVNPIQIPYPYKVEYWKCNGQTISGGEVFFDEGFGEVCVRLGQFIEDHKKAFIDKVEAVIYNEFDPSSIIPLTLNFTDLVFIGNKKQS